MFKVKVAPTTTQTGDVFLCSALLAGYFVTVFDFVDSTFRIAVLSVTLFKDHQLMFHIPNKSQLDYHHTALLQCSVMPTCCNGS